MRVTLEHPDRPPREMEIHAQGRMLIQPHYDDRGRLCEEQYEWVSPSRARYARTRVVEDPA